MGRIGCMVLALAGLVSACGQAPTPPVEPDPTTQRTVVWGDLIGFRDTDTRAQVWLGVPFADAPEGDLRWKAPRWPEPWDGVREATDHAEMCPQVTNQLNAEATGVEPGQLIGSEDCLYLDIYAPENAGPDTANRPVMVWIHGGGNVWGSSAQYDGSQLAVDQNVVVIALQYRLGPIGFFAHPVLRAQDHEIEQDAAANFALLDQLAALYWIRDNVAQFGGDPDNVTVFGESAGGHNVAGLLASPLADNLFHRAIIQSGLVDSVPLEEAQSEGDFSALAAGERFAGPNADAQALRDADLQAIYDAYAGDETGDGLPRMIADGVTLPAEGLMAAFESTDTFNAVPVITGTNRDEMKLFNIFHPDLTHTWFGSIIRVNDQTYFDAMADYQSRLWRVLAVDELANTMQAAGHNEVWAYRFDWDEGGTIFFMDLSKLLGAAHAMEIPFVFNHFEFFGRLDDPLFNRRNAEGREALAASMGAYWAEFARTGDPGSAGGPDWPVWEESGRLMRFDSPAEGGQTLITGPDSLAQLNTDLASDTRLEPEQRCAIREALLLWAPDQSAFDPMGCTPSD